MGGAVLPEGEGELEARGDLLHELAVILANRAAEEAREDITHGRPLAAHCTTLRMR